MYHCVCGHSRLKHEEHRVAHHKIEWHNCQEEGCLCCRFREDKSRLMNVDEYNPAQFSQTVIKTGFNRLHKGFPGGPREALMRKYGFQ